MKRASVIAGLLFGLLLGVIQAFQLTLASHSLVEGLVGGLFAGIFSGALFGGALYLFVNSRAIKSQISLNSNELIDNESIIFSKLANLVVRPKDFGLKNFAFDDFLWAVGMKDKEALGGSLHLTNFRLIFKSHRFNRLRGKTSVFLPTILEVKKSSFLLARKMTLETSLAKVELVIFDVDDVIEQILRARDSMSLSSLELIRSQVVSKPSTFGDGLESWNSLNTINNLINLGKKTGDTAEVVTNPLGALTSIFMKELFDRTVSEWWQRKFEPKA